MKKIFFYLLVLLLSTWLGLHISQDPGHVIIQYSGTNIETTLWFAVIFFIISLSITLATIKIIGSSCNKLSTIKKNIFSFSRKKRAKFTITALKYCMQEKWPYAIKFFSKTITQRNSLFNILATAYAASQGELAEEKKYIQQAYTHYPKETVFITSFHASLYLQKRQYNNAIIIIDRLADNDKNNAEITSILSQCHYAMGNWESLKDLLKKCYKYGVLDLRTRQQMEKDYYSHKMNNCNEKELVNLWHALPRYARENPNCLLPYLLLLKQKNNFTKALKIIEQYIAYSWNIKLLDLYREIAIKNNSNIVPTLTKWLEKHNNDNLLLSLARAHKQRNEVQQAIKIYETIIAKKAKPLVIIELSDIYSKINNHEQANKWQKAAIKILKEYDS